MDNFEEFKSRIINPEEKIPVDGRNMNLLIRKGRGESAYVLALRFKYSEIDGIELDSNLDYDANELNRVGQPGCFMKKIVWADAKKNILKIRELFDCELPIQVNVEAKCFDVAPDLPLFNHWNEAVSS